MEKNVDPQQKRPATLSLDLDIKTVFNKKTKNP